MFKYDLKIIFLLISLFIYLMFNDKINFAKQFSKKCSKKKKLSYLHKDNHLKQTEQCQTPLLFFNKFCLTTIFHHHSGTYMTK